MKNREKIKTSSYVEYFFYRIIFYIEISMHSKIVLARALFPEQKTVSKRKENLFTSDILYKKLFIKL